MIIDIMLFLDFILWIMISKVGGYKSFFVGLLIFGFVINLSKNHPIIFYLTNGPILLVIGFMIFLLYYSKKSGIGGVKNMEH